MDDSPIGRSEGSISCRVAIGTYPISKPGGGVRIKTGSMLASVPIANHFLHVVPQRCLLLGGESMKCGGGAIGSDGEACGRDAGMWVIHNSGYMLCLHFG
jgi:hypothetical protein